MNLQTIRTLLIDGDGVLWRANDPMPGLVHFFDVLAARGITWGLLTNNASLSVANYVEKLDGFGVMASPTQIFTSAVVAADTLREMCPPGAPVYVIGESGLKEAILAAGFMVYGGEEQPDEAAAVVAGIDRSLTYDKLKVATRLIRGQGVPFIGTNPDKTFPTPHGLVPGAGSILAALAAASDREPLIVGKPAATMFRVAMQRLGGTPETTAMLGDRIETDIEGAQQMGLRTILVLSGVTTREETERSPVRPDSILDDVAALAAELEKGSA
jgi:4-nitrophenyl phosphatase